MDKSKYITGVYQIGCLVNNKIYIGSSESVVRRIKVHTKQLNNNKHPNPHLQNAYNKYGYDKFVYELVEVCDKESLFKIEQIFIDSTQSYLRDVGYNLSSVSEHPNNLGKMHIVGFPDGHEEVIKNIYKFANENGLDISCLYKTKVGKIGSHKGFYLRPIDLPLEEWKPFVRQEKKTWNMIRISTGETFVIDDMRNFCKSNNLSIRRGLKYCCEGKRDRAGDYICFPSDMTYEEWQVLRESNRKFMFTVITPNGETIDIKVLKEFCKNNKLAYQGCSRVVDKDILYKGYRFFTHKENYRHNEVEVGKSPPTDTMPS
jgi:predicted GIY-YIG superfamily endonuclease